MTIRYAIYYAPPPDTPLWRFGSAVLGYDAAACAEVTALAPATYTKEEWHAATRDPRKYGFHATLKAPFELNTRYAEIDLLEALATFCAIHAPVELGDCPVAATSAQNGFVAFMPRTPPPALAHLERQIVEGFDRYRAPLTAADRARRNPDALTERQRTYLDAFGYPYIFEEFGFHMTLTGRIADAEMTAVQLGRLATSFDIGPTIAIDRLCLFRQKDNLSRFEIIAAHPLSFHQP